MSKGNVRSFYSVTPKAFRKALKKTKQPHMVDVQSEHFYDRLVSMGGICMLNVGHDAGFAVDREGELLSMFNESGTKGLAGVMIEHAKKHGAMKVFCYTGHLSDLYRKHGFVEYASEEWNDEYANEWPDGDQPKPGGVVWMKIPKD